MFQILRKYASSCCDYYSGHDNCDARHRGLDRPAMKTDTPAMVTRAVGMSKLHIQ